MIATVEYANILDHSEALSRMILDSEDMHAYQEAKYALDHDKEAQQLIQAFIDIKEHYEDVQRFGRYHPDYNQIMKSVRSTKREMDMNDKVAAFKIAERNIQKLLDEVSSFIALSVSEDIKAAPSFGALISWLTLKAI